jgi:hypothetical protein
MLMLLEKLLWHESSLMRKLIKGYSKNMTEIIPAIMPKSLEDLEARASLVYPLQSIKQM